MYDRGKIITGIIIFLVLLFIPFLYNFITGKATYVPEPVIGTSEKECVESKVFMRTDHMKLLDEWKETVVRHGVRNYKARNGKTYTIDITGTCMECHTDKEKFCDRCHNYAGVEPKCWNCHVYKKVADK